ncbi:hypothetical protein K7X08_023661 [Anisodus acutangulus]|uniref:C2H2-type domain-containing protein n=1 Tax=Anisodus acutangulus TaxID=402998 RepID=A0A9Q1L8W2_9SOLA|nr:hypothetical protein K7X08_023661 [Anisodus acutangulus]
MENQDHKITTPSGHENHGPHLCHKCGWPFPNAHPSSRHRRAHKKVCGKIEGYKLSELETADNSTHSAVSNDEHHSDGDHRTPSPNDKMTSVKSYQSEDETFSDAVTEFPDSGISPGMEERPGSVKHLSTNVIKIDDELLKANATGDISGSSNDTQHAAEVNDPESLESAIDHPEVAGSLSTKLDRPSGSQLDSDPMKSKIPEDASLQEINASESIEAKQMQMSSGQPNDLKGMEDINTGEGLVDAGEASVEVSQSVVSDTDEKTSNNESYESKPLEEEGKISSPSIVESKLLEAEEQATNSVPIGAELQHKERENPDSAYLKLDLPEADVKALDVVNVDKEHEQLGCCIRGGGISTQLSPMLVSKADGGRQVELSDSSKAEEGREDVHVVSLAKDLTASDNPELLLKDFKDYDKFKFSLPLDLGSSEEISSAKDDAVAASEVSQSFVDTDGSISTVALDISVDQVSEEKAAVSAEGKTDMNTYIASVQEEAKQATKVDDLEIERTETSFTIAEENKGGHPEDELLTNKETTPVDTSRISEANQTMVTVEGIDQDEHEKASTEHPIVAGDETEEKLAGVSEGDKTIYPVGGHNNHAIATDTTTLHESREEIFHEASKDDTISSDAKALESASATGLDSKVISDCDVKESTGLFVDTVLNSHVVDNSHAGDGLKSAAGVIPSASQNEGNDKLVKQNDTVSAVSPMTSSSRADSLDANWGSVSVLSTQSESTAVTDAETTDTRKPTSESHPDKSDVYEPPSSMTLVESGESADKKTAASEIETHLNSQQPKTEALAGWFPSITNVVNESQGRKKNDEEIIAKVTNWSGTTKQHTPLKNLLGEARSPNAKQVPKKDETASTKTTTVNSILSSEAAPTKEAEKEWNSPARYPVDIKKEKRKTKPYWVPFVCCSSVHQDA